ncbi:hypothetical protein ACN20G_12775 [Streptomyces sp. BI20]|uniref:hypothetical protein n=1 Tax=Streptomyces sp. BI20 TaxID=3403460 RepID=UPI003C778A93
MPVRRRPPRVLLLALAVGLGAVGCADAEGLRDVGDLGEVKAPLTLWPALHPSPAAPGQRPGTAAPVPGVARVPDGSLAGVSALSLLRADITAATRQDGGTGRLVDPRAVQRLALCDESESGGPKCPMRPPVLNDVTDDGKPDLIVALDLDGRLSELRVYTVRDGVVTRVLARRAVLEGVEVAAGHLAVREPTSNPSKVSVSDYTWDKDAGSMVLSQLTLDSCAATTTAAATDPGVVCPAEGT